MRRIVLARLQESEEDSEEQSMQLVEWKLWLAEWLTSEREDGGLLDEWFVESESEQRDNALRTVLRSKLPLLAQLVYGGSFR